MEFNIKFRKGEILDTQLDDFIMSSLMKLTKIEQIKGGYPHDFKVVFKKDSNFKLSVE